MNAPRPVDAVVFDMDGTLLDSTATVPAAYVEAIFELCGRRPSEDEVIAAYSAGPAGALIAQFVGRPTTEADVDCWHRHLADHLHRTTIYAGVADLLAELRRDGIKLAVFTGATRHAAALQLRHADLLDYLDAVVASDEIDHVKPAPDGLLRACHLLCAEPERTAYVGDALNDLRCARAAGAVPVAAAWGHLHEPDDEPHLLALTPVDVLHLLC